MYKYAQLNILHHDRQIQVYMYAFIYVYPQTMPVEDNFPDTKTCVGNYNKMSTPWIVPKHWLGFSYIRLEDCELDKNFDDVE